MHVQVDSSSTSSVASATDEDKYEDANEDEITTDSECSIKSELTNLFQRVDRMQSSADIYNLKHLIATIVDAFILLPPDFDHDSLQKFAYELAISKVSGTIFDAFHAQYDDESLYSLFFFVRLEIIDHDETRFYLRGSQENSTTTSSTASSSNSSPSGSPPQHTYCRYCRQYGHPIGQCPEIFCNSCFHLGHTRNRCTVESEPLFVFVK